jgi:hypothetical protein
VRSTISRVATACAEDGGSAGNPPRVQRVHGEVLDRGSALLGRAAELELARRANVRIVDAQ